MLALEEVYDVTIVKDGQEAYDTVKSNMEKGEVFDLIFMDIQVSKPTFPGKCHKLLITTRCLYSMDSRALGLSGRWGTLLLLWHSAPLPRKAISKTAWIVEWICL